MARPPRLPHGRTVTSAPTTGADPAPRRAGRRREAPAGAARAGTQPGALSVEPGRPGAGSWPRQWWELTTLGAAFSIKLGWEEGACTFCRRTFHAAQPTSLFYNPISSSTDTHSGFHRKAQVLHAETNDSTSPYFPTPELHRLCGRTQMLTTSWSQSSFGRVGGDHNHHPWQPAQWAWPE